MFASVVVDVASSNVDQFYEYLIPTHLEHMAQVGVRVKVNFGKTTKKIIMGYIVDLYENKQFDGEAKLLEDIVDNEPVISPEQLKLAYLIKEDTICPLIRILNTMIPDALRLKSVKYLELLNPSAIDAKLLELFKNSSKIIYTKELDDYKSIINKEINNNNLVITHDAKQYTPYKYVNYYLVDKDSLININSLRSKDSRNFLNDFVNYPYTSQKDILENFKITSVQLKSLVTKGFLKVNKQKVSRIKDHKLNIDSIKLNNNYQDQVIRFSEFKHYFYIPSNLDEHDNVLINLVKETITNNQNVLLLCPEILTSLKYQSLLEKTLKIDVGCINSNLSSGEYLDYYDSIVNNEYSVIVSTPKGALLPYQNLGLIIMIGEESDNYYNDQSPRYDLKKVMNDYSSIINSKLVLMSLTPDLNTYCDALQNKYTLIDNSKDQIISNVEIIDMKNELLNGNTNLISQTLLSAMQESAKMKEKSLLIVGNKNYSSFVMCRSCGEIETCKSCGISMQYNEKRNVLICPACGRFYPFTNKCNKCGSNNLLFGGVGMEQVKENLSKIDKSLRYLTVDESKYIDFDNALCQLDEDEVDVIITTPTIANAFSSNYFKNVGIVSFDTFLKNPSYDATSKAYNLLNMAYSKQTLNGKLYIQTNNQDNVVIKDFINGNLHEFVKHELLNRKAAYNEPYLSVNRIIVKAKYEEMFKAANNIKLSLKNIGGKALYVIGPTYSKRYAGAVIIVKHNYKDINNVYRKIYEMYQTTDVMVIFDKYARNL